MRRAQTMDHWRHIERASNQPFRLQRFSFADIEGVDDGEFALQAPLTALCGRNGAGKSTVIRAIGALFQAEVTATSVRHRLQHAKLSGEVLWRGQTVEFTNSTSEDATWVSDVRVCVVDPTETTEVKGYFAGLTPEGRTELVEAFAAVPFDEDQLALANYVLSRRYGAVHFSEVEVEVGAFEVVPYFRVEDGENGYGSENMGLGEFCVFHLLWLLFTLPRTGALVIIEEPESFLSPAAQRRLMDVVAKICDESRVWVVLTTHSPAILSNIPDSNIYVLRRDQNGRILFDKALEPDYLERLDLRPRKRGLVLVEDVAARELLYRLADQKVDGFRSRYEVVVCPRGESQIRAAVDVVPRAEAVEMLGVLDGDQELGIAVAGGWPLVLLPGPVAPDELLLEAVHQNPGGLANVLGVVLSRLQEKLELLDGQDHHDWAPILAGSLGRSTVEVLSAAARLWVEDEKNANATSDFGVQLATALETARG